MATEVSYEPGREGDWGTPRTGPGGVYATENFTQPDGTQVFVRSWRAADASAPVLLLLHGLGAHTGWFIDMGSALNERGVSVYMDDHRGFGRSQGPRGHVKRGGIYVDDARRLLAEVHRRHPDAPVSVLGHSMGGLFALYLAADDARSNRGQVNGLILMNPWIADTSKLSLGSLLNIGLAGAFGSSRPVSAAGGPDVMTNNAEAVRMLDADPYWVREQSAAFLYQIGLRLRQGAIAQAKDVRAPALVIQSEEDQAVVPDATRRCYDALGSSDKTWKSLPGYHHDAELEAERTALDDTIAAWLMRASSAAGKPQ